MQKKIIHYYIISFFQLFISEIIGVSYVLFLLHKKFNMFESNMLMAVMLFSVFLLEIPTGAVADLFGRKISVSLGFFSFFVFTLIYIFSDSFVFLVLGQIFWALSTTLQSGAFDAWIVDSINYHKLDRNLPALFSKTGTIRNFAGIFCGLLGAYLADFKFEIPWMIGSLTALCLAFYSFIVMNEPYLKDVKKKRGLKNIFHSIKDLSKESLSFIKGNNVFIYFILISILVSFSNSAGNMLQQPRLVGLFNGGIWVFGWIKAGYSLCMAFGSFFIGYLANKYHFKDYQMMLISNLTIGFFLFMSGVFNNFPLVLSTFLLYEVGRGMLNPTKQSFLNSRISSSNRATILSFEAMLSSLGMILGLLVTGFISRNFINLTDDQDPIRLSWIISGLLPLFACLFVFKIKSLMSKEGLNSK